MGADGEKNTFIIYTEWQALFEALSPEDNKALIIAICQYTRDGEMPKLTGEAMGVFLTMKLALDKNTAAYWEAKAKKSEGGKKGMATRWGADNAE